MGHLGFSEIHRRRKNKNCMKEVEQIEAVSSPASGRGGGHDGVLRMDDRR